MGCFIKLLGGKKYQIKHGKSGLTITILQNSSARKIFKNEFKNWSHLYNNFDKL